MEMSNATEGGVCAYSEVWGGESVGGTLSPCCLHSSETGKNPSFVLL